MHNIDFGGSQPTVNNNFKYRSGTLMDNGYHYFPDDRMESQQQAEFNNRHRGRNKSKWVVANDAAPPPRMQHWSQESIGNQPISPQNTPSRMHHRSSTTTQKKSQQLLPFVHYHSENRSAAATSSVRINKSQYNNNSSNNNLINNARDERSQHRFYLLEEQPLLTPSTVPIDFRGEKSPDAGRFPTDQHYEHYYSYYYNRQSNFQERKNRKLPDTTGMAAAKKNVDEYFTSTISTHNHDPHILKEKVNNNIIHDDDGAWQFGQEVNESKLSSRNLMDVKEYNISLAAFGESPRQLNGTRVRGGYSSHSAAGEPTIHSHQRVQNLDDNHASQTRRSTGEEGDVKTQRQAKLPVTPSFERTVKTQATVRRSPTPRPRVLLYNQSPRQGRTAYTYVGQRLQEWRRGHQSKSPAINASEKIKKRYLNGIVQSNRAANTDCYVVGDVQTVAGITVGKRFTLGKKGEQVDEDDASSIDDEVDDDLDNVSEFGSDVSGSSSDEDGYRVYAYKLAHTVEKTQVQSHSRSVSSAITDSLEEPMKTPISLLAPSLFPNVPPYLSFSTNTSRGPEVPPELYRILKWRISNVMPKVVRHVLANSGMRLLKKTNEWMGVWGKHLKSPCFRTIRSYQKINHLPGSFKIGRKDSLWKSLQKHSIKHGKREFGFMPKTYIIPNDLIALRKAWPRYASRNVKWIIKPPASARGAGIRVVSKWAQIPKRRPLIVQRYIERPLLINGSKFDLRLYVLVTSMNPLRVYLYHNGLARFASVKYSDRTDTLHDRCMHLTNYSINKLSSNYAKNEDVNACHGHKWTIKSLWNYLATRGVRTDYLWQALRALVLRTLIVGESSINNMIRMNVESKYSVYELFGFDILLDADLIPWLLEVNISPSLHSELPLDAHVKAPLVQAVLNTALYNIPPKLSMERQRELAAKMSYVTPGPICYDKRMYINYLSRAEKVKHNTFTRKSIEDREEYLEAILEHLTPDDLRCLIVAEDELSRSTPLERIFPTKDTHKYLKYCDSPRYYNRLLDAWETRYANNRQAGIGLLTAYCLNKYHLQVPQAPVKKYFEDDDIIYYSPPEQDIVVKTGLCHQISEMDFKIVIAAIVFVTIASTILCAISFTLVKQYQK